MVKFCGLYAIADTSLIPKDRLFHKVLQAIHGGARLIQLRDKSNKSAGRTKAALALRELCRDLNVLFIINDDVELACIVDADGVHLGCKDATLEDARSALGKRPMIGISCYNQWSRAIAAADGGADYVAFGRFFASRTKPEAALADLQLLRDARARLTVPVVAIGGITPDNGSALVEAGAHMLAAIHGIFGRIDTQTAASSYAKLFNCD